MRKSRIGGQKATRPPWQVPAGENPYRLLADGIQEYAIWLMDLGATIQSWNPGATRILGYDAGNILGRSFHALFPDADIHHGRPEAALLAATEAGRIEDEGCLQRKDGSRFWARLEITALRDPDGELYGFGVVMRDVTEVRQKDEELRRIEDRSRRFWAAAITDPLTGAYNRRYLMEHLRGEMDRNEHGVGSLLLFDVDRFKAINDTYGHDAGDLVLRNVAAVARKILRSADELYRLGGDEFVLYLPGVSVIGARALAERLRQAVANSALPGTQAVTISVGVAQRQPDDTLDSWLRTADLALYEAKQAGRNRVA